MSPCHGRDRERLLTILGQVGSIGRWGEQGKIHRLTGTQQRSNASHPPSYVGGAWLL